MHNVKYFIKNPRKIAIPIITKFFKWLPDRLYLKLLFRATTGLKLDLKNPKTFSEKLQWLKLYNRKPEYTTMVDKYAVKDYVANKIGKEYIIPTLGVWDTPEQIDWDSLPEKFVLKTTHGGGGSGVVICKDKKTFDKEKAMLVLKESYNQDLYKILREWPYKNVPKRIIAEQLLENKTKKKELSDYKFYCFNGVPRMMYITTDRNQKTGLCEDFFDMNGNLLPIQQKGEKNNPITPKLPIAFNKMIELSTTLSRDIPLVRIDFYEVDDKIKFGEITFYDGSGFALFTPFKYEKIIGSWIELPIKE
ncbi:MAG: ATP-grasp fold amidoligase family protein [Bacteroidales bacterium]|nr:ATP-grasp fold amidoligase family protein [Bacteroidales bacterium]